MIRLILADDHPMFLSGLQALLAAEDDLEVLAAVATGEDALAAALQHRPDVAVLDLTMPGGDGLGVTQRMRSAALPTRALILTMYDDDENVLAALRAGAYGYALKGAGPEEIIAAVRAVARGEAVFGAGVAARILGHFARAATASPFPQLTDREQEVLSLVARGMDNGAIARRLGLTGKTVRNHVSNVLTKLQVPDRSAAIQRARDAGLGGGPGR